MSVRTRPGPGLRRAAVTTAVVVALGLWALGVGVVVHALAGSPMSPTGAARADRRTSGPATRTVPAAGRPAADASGSGVVRGSGAQPSSGRHPAGGATAAATPPRPASTPAPSTPTVSAARAVGATTTLADPAHNIAPSPDFLQWCPTRAYSDSLACVEAALGAIDHARALEGVGPMVLPEGWTRLTPQEQLFAVTNLERTARGLPAVTAMSTVLDGQATAGAADGTDPDPGTGLTVTAWGSNWGDGVGSALEIDYEWMYDDGPGSPNVACPRAGMSGCWGHRRNILMTLPCRECLMGAGFEETDGEGFSAWTVILAEANQATSVDFTWEDLVRAGR